MKLFSELKKKSERKVKKYVIKVEEVEVSESEVIEVIKDVERKIDKFLMIYKLTTEFSDKVESILREVFEKDIGVKVFMLRNYVEEAYMSTPGAPIICAIDFDIWCSECSEENNFIIRFLGEINDVLRPSKWKFVIMPSKLIESKDEKVRKKILENTINMIEKIYPILNEKLKKLAEEFKINIDIYKVTNVFVWKVVNKLS